MIHDALDLDLVEPVDPDHDLNRGRVAWWLAPPPAAGGPRLYDLLGRTPGDLLNFAAPRGWRADRPYPGALGPALVYDGVDDRVTASGLDGLAGSSSTFACWVRVEAFSAQGCVLFGTNTGAAVYWQIRGGVQGVAISGSLVDGDAGFSWADGAWRRLCMTASPTATKLYVDGRPKLTGPAPTAIAAGAKSWMLGDWAGSPGSSWRLNGALADASAWNRTFSDDDAGWEHDLARRGYPGVLRRLPGARTFRPGGPAPVSYSPSGGAVLGGSAARALSYSPSGGAALGGSAAAALAFGPSGGAILGGSAAPQLSYPPSGGVAVSGSAAAALAFAPSGGVALSGSAARPRRFPTRLVGTPRVEAARVDSAKSRARDL